MVERTYDHDLILKGITSSVNKAFIEYTTTLEKIKKGTYKGSET